jgi:hypothetical protein
MADDKLELADSQMIAKQVAKVTLKMIHSLHGSNCARPQWMAI